MGPVLKTRLTKENNRFNAYLPVRKRPKEAADENVDGLLKNTVGGVVAKIISTVNWTYTSLFGKTSSEELSLNKETLRHGESQDSAKKGDESMLSESRTPYLLGYTPHRVRIQHLREGRDQEAFRREE